MLIHLTRHSLIYWSFISTLGPCMNFQRDSSNLSRVQLRELDLAQGNPWRQRRFTSLLHRSLASQDYLERISLSSTKTTVTVFHSSLRDRHWFLVGHFSSSLSSSILNNPVSLSLSLCFFFAFFQSQTSFSWTLAEFHNWNISLFPWGVRVFDQNPRVVTGYTWPFTRKRLLGVCLRLSYIGYEARFGRLLRLGIVGSARKWNSMFEASLRLVCTREARIFLSFRWFGIICRFQWRWVI